jgi:thioredoxin-related protein
MPKLAHSLLGALIPAFFALAIPTTAHAETRDPQEYFFHQSFNDLTEEAQTARDDNLTGLLIMFSDPDCPWCQKMKVTVLSRPAIQDYYRAHFRILHMDTRGDGPVTNFDGTILSEKDLAFKVHRVRATPVFIFFDPDGNPVQRFTGATRDATEFLLLGQFVVSGEYRNTNFTRYKRKARQAATVSGLSAE